MQLLANLTGMHRKITPGSGDGNNSRYRCVEVRPETPDCCQAARGIAGNRFLSDEVPALPLEGCDAAECQCSYKLLEDRRSGRRRRSDATDYYAVPCFESQYGQRSSPGRRHDD
jgi:hypothetical protein